MKKLLFSIIIVTNLGCNWMNGKSIKGNGNVTIENRGGGEYNKIEVSGVFNIVLKQADKNEVKVEADDNLQQYVFHKIENNTLYIRTQENINIRKAKKMNVIISFVDLVNLKNSMVGNLRSEDTIKTNRMEIVLSAVGNTDLLLNVAEIKINNSAVGNTHLEGISNSCEFINSAVGNVEASKWMVGNMTLKNSAVGNTTVNVQSLQLENSAVGKIKNVYNPNP